MNFIKTDIEGLWIIEPKVFGDERGYFMETYKTAEFEEHAGRVRFIQDNESCSSKGVLRGLHFQAEPYSQAKLVRVIIGSVLDVAVDIRPNSPSYGKHVAVELSGENKRQLFIPRGFAHGFYVLSDTAVFAYKVDNQYVPSAEKCIRYDDPTLNINWRIKSGDKVIVSPKDQNGMTIKDYISQQITISSQ
ncbi:MAG: dTDP-4-dehydrorhamnose 3,5-epimerase [Tannerella sp.]|jgi:dTDP-4-dehydrorhamnose 3,5-epimerase|nr:dTDP-4-dehydrorhamnose 3,5-epimerase [Tannerella sp.]